MVNLKPCPFCGEDVYLEKRPLWQSYNGVTHGYYGCYEFDICCMNPNCRCRIYLGENTTINNNKKEAMQNAIKAWNRRCNDENHNDER